MKVEVIDGQEYGVDVHGNKVLIKKAQVPETPAYVKAQGFESLIEYRGWLEFNGRTGVSF